MRATCNEAQSGIGPSWQLFDRRYGDRVVSQDWIHCAGGQGHGGTYEVAGNQWKKYTLYLKYGPIADAWVDAAA